MNPSLRLNTYARFVKFEHTIFSLPLIVAGTLIHTHAWPETRLLVFIVLAAIGGRILAMGLNRIIDSGIDAHNPRTALRELPRKAMRPWEAWIIVFAAGLLYGISAASIAPICLWLSPIPVVLFVIYPYLKRFTTLCHLGLGVAWSMAPLGGWLAASQSLSGFGQILWLWVFSILWVAGFDIIYATMDEAFDREWGLHSLPARVGRRKALQMSQLIHCLAFASLMMLWATQLQRPRSWVWLAGIALLFIAQHRIAERHPTFAFFQINAALGFFVFGLVLAGLD